MTADQHRWAPSLSPRGLDKAVVAGPVRNDEAGGVRLGLERAADIRRAAGELRAVVAACGHRLEAFVVAPMASGGVELTVGVAHDSSFGPVIVCALAGALAEVRSDAAVRITPLTDVDAHALLRSLRGFPLLSGHDGAPPCDLPAIEEVLLRLSALVEAHPEGAELDISPLLACERGAVIIDAHVRVEAPPPRRPLSALRRYRRSRDRCFAAVDRRPYPLSAPRANAYFGRVAVHLQIVSAPTERSECPAGSGLISVVLADDHELMRARLRSLLEDDEQIEVIADTGELGEAIGCVLRTRPRVLVLDMSMPSGSSIEAIRRLRARVPDTEIVALKMNADAAFARHAFEAGAVAFVVKDTADGELLDAVRLAARGERYLSPRIAAGYEASCPAAGEIRGPVGSSARSVVPPATLESSSNVPPTR